MTIYATSPEYVAAVQYDEEWHPDSVDKVARFLLGLKDDQDITTGDVLMVLEPSGAWNPPKHADLWVKSPGLKSVCRPGDWVVTNIVNGEVKVLNPAVFDRLYHKATAKELAALGGVNG